MVHHRKLPLREHVFVLSLMRHGFRLTRRREGLKWKKGYVIPTTKSEDASGVDFLIKMPRDDRLFEIQLTQRGTTLYAKYHRASAVQMEEHVKIAEARLRRKRSRCRKHGIAFVLVRDYDGSRTNPQMAWGDVKAVRNALAYVA